MSSFEVNFAPNRAPRRAAAAQATEANVADPDFTDADLAELSPAHESDDPVRGLADGDGGELPNRQRESRAAGDQRAIDPLASEDVLADARLGQRIKRLRLKHSMGLVELGRQTGLSASFLSQLETGRVVPTLRNLARLAIVFNKDISFFFDQGDTAVFRVQRGKDRVRLPMGSPQPDYIAESFGILIPEGGLRPCLAEFLPGPNRNPFYPDLYPGIEMTVVLRGHLSVQRNGDPHVLGPRDVAYISGETERVYRCEGSEPCTAMIVSFDVDSGDLRRVSRRRGSSAR